MTGQGGEDEDVDDFATCHDPGLSATMSGFQISIFPTPMKRPLLLLLPVTALAFFGTPLRSEVASPGAAMLVEGLLVLCCA